MISSGKKWQGANDAPNLTIILMCLVALINGLDLLLGNDMISISLRDGLDGRWVDLLLFPFRVSTNWIFLFLFLYINWIFGSQLEAEMGMLRYGFYLLSACVFVLLGTYFYPLTAAYVFYSVFLAVAWRSPDTSILLFFILPVKLKWAALFSLFIFVFPHFLYAYQSQNFAVLLAPFLCLLNFLLFHYKDMFLSLKRRFLRRRR